MCTQTHPLWMKALVKTKPSICWRLIHSNYIPPYLFGSLLSNLEITILATTHPKFSNFKLIKLGKTINIGIRSQRWNQFGDNRILQLFSSMRCHQWTWSLWVDSDFYPSFHIWFGGFLCSFGWCLSSLTSFGEKPKVFLAFWSFSLSFL